MLMPAGPEMYLQVRLAAWRAQHVDMKAQGRGMAQRSGAAPVAFSSAAARS